MEKLYSIIECEGFTDVDIHHVGGLWVWIAFKNQSACQKFKNKVSLRAYFSDINPVMRNFVVDERMVWIEIEGLPLCAWGSKALKEIRESWANSCSSKMIMEKMDASTNDSELGSCPPGFEFLKHDKKDVSQTVDEGNSQLSNCCPKRFCSRCATSFGSKRRIKSVSSSSDGKKGVNMVNMFKLKSMWGNFQFNFACSSARGHSEGIISMWYTGIFVKSSIQCGENFVVVDDWINELAKLDRIYALDAAQKAKVKWDIEGDKNTSFFHGLLKQRRRLQMVKGIMHDGEWCTNPEHVKRTFLDFYRDKFSASQFVTPNLPQSRYNHLSAEEIEELERPVTIDEIKYAVWQCGSDKRPGPYGFSFKMSVLVNGSLTGEIDLHRGLRQGDPLSPFLFIIAMEWLHLAIEKAIEDNKISRALIGVDRVKVSHLFYVDDMVFLTKWTARDVDGILNVLNEFYNSLGLKINVKKSNMYGVGVLLDEIANMTASTRCTAGNLPFNYLGITIGASMTSKGMWDKGSQEDAKKIAWVVWEKVIAEKERGGLGIGSLASFNLALLQKWRWRFFNVDGALWCNVVKAIHGEYEGLDNREISRVKTCTWARIIGGGTEYQQLQVLTQAISHVALREGLDKLWWDIDIQAKEVWKRMYNWCQVYVRDINDLSNGLIGVITILMPEIVK
nr:RNA-directed DNA polymerase, eukaryota, reverse transcriptase zinc-binding domain protein [Tanacetum cinerariifolium]